MKSIRREISDVFGILIGENEWESTFHELDKENRLNSKNVNKILLVILKKLEEMECQK